MNKLKGAVKEEKRNGVECSVVERIKKDMGQDARRQKNAATRIDKTRGEETRHERKGHKKKRSKTDKLTD